MAGTARVNTMSERVSRSDSKAFSGRWSLNIQPPPSLKTLQ